MPPETLTRRGFVHLVGRAAGAAGVYATLNGMGLLRVPSAYAGPPALPAGSGRHVRVVIIGAGIAGMVSAYELRKAGYTCTILEARDRPGGRCWTVRGGDAIDEIGSHQQVTWDRKPHLYFNAGPARIPYHHQGILSYCRELGVPLEILANENRGALLQSDAAFGGRPQLAREVINDTRGFVAELAAKAIAPGALDQALTAEDLDRLRDLLKEWGDLDGAFHYRGSSRGGYAEAPGGGHKAGLIRPPLPLAEILRATNWQHLLPFGEDWEYAAPMMQPVGGMDRIAHAFAHALGPVITYNAEVTRLERLGERARIVWRDRLHPRREKTVEADYVLCTAPLPVLGNIQADFSPAVHHAIQVGARVYVPAVKIAFQCDERWWETDNHIYGGITWTSRDITQIWYPTAGIHAEKGILVGGYIWNGDTGDRYAAMPPDKRITAAITQGEQIHPGYATRVSRGATVAWSKIPWSGGAWGEWDHDPPARRDLYPVLLEPDGPFYFAGEHMSHINAWQEGAVRSAHYTIEKLAERVGSRPARARQ